ncbi:venom acid phosphatase Acph-1-like [Diachasmimorpha longicaudata]|uniref:venom acid phosphatase Acph-1-like n=1 Tax=Diachasmimorpha longicaudata TaxID=58733 RepID=UPI0030B8D991
MKFNYVWAIFCFILHSKFCNAELDSVLVLVHHTESNPDLDIYKEYPHLRRTLHSNLPEGAKQLTIEGKQHALRLGAVLGSTYSSLIPQITNLSLPINLPVSTLNLIAMNATKAVQTAKLVGLGLHMQDQKLVDKFVSGGVDLTKMPEIGVDVGASETLSNMFFDAWRNCPGYMASFKKLENSAFSRLDFSTPAYQKIDRYAGTATNLAQYRNLWTYFREKMNTRYLPEVWTQAIFPEGDLKRLMLLNYGLHTWTPEMRSLFGTRMLLETIMRDHPMFHHTERIGVYVGDDMHIVGLLSALKAYDEEHIPQYGSHVILELHKIDGKSYIQIKYHKSASVTAPPVLLELPGKSSSGGLYPISEFKDTVEELYLPQLKRFCNEV